MAYVFEEDGQKLEITLGGQGDGYVFEDEKPSVAPADYGVGSELLSGLTFGFGDELRSKVTGESIDAIRAGQDKFREDHPIGSVVANMAGALPTMLIPGGGAANVLRGAGMGMKAARIAAVPATGAVYGAASGAGEAGTDEKSSGAFRGGLLGSVMSPIGAGIGRGIQSGIGRGMQATGKIETVPRDLQAQTILRGRLAAAGMTPAEAQAKLTRGQTLAELGALEDTAGSVLRRSPETAQVYRELTEGRKAARGDQLLNTAQQEITGGFAPTSGQIEKITQMQKAASKPFYDEAFATAKPIQSPVIDSIMTKEPFQRAYKVAQQIADLEGNPIPDYVAGQPLTLRQANYVKQGIDDMIFGAKRDPQSSITKSQLSLINGLRRDFVNEVDSQAPEAYRKARSIYAGGARAQEAGEQGAKAWQKGPEFVADFLRTANEAEKATFRAGANAALQSNAAKLGSNREAFRALMDSPKNQQVAQMLSNTEGPSALPALARSQKAQAEFETRMAGGSQTASRRAADELFDQETLPMQIARDGPKQALLGGALRGVMDRVRTGGNATTADLGRMLFTTDAGANSETLRRLGLLDDIIARNQSITTKATVGGASATGLLGGSQ